MVDITSGTVNATPLGDFWIGTLQVGTAGAHDGDVVNLSHTNFLGDKAKEIVFAYGVRESQNSGSVDVSPVSWISSSGSVTIGNSGTQRGASGTTGEASPTNIDSGRSTLGNYVRNIVFMVRSQRQ